MLKHSIKEIPGIGEYYAKVLIQSGIRTWGDLIWIFPKSRVKVPVADMLESNAKGVAMNLVIKTASIRPGARKMTIVKASTKSGQEVYITFFSHSKLFFPSSKICVYGEAKIENGRIFMTHPKWSYGHSAHYEENEYTFDKVPQAIIKKSILYILERISGENCFRDEWLPRDFVEEKSWPSLVRSFQIIQTSDDKEEIQKARHRLRFEEALSYLFGLRLAQTSATKYSESYKLRDIPMDDLLDRFGFHLTECQQRAWDEIRGDLLNEKQMLRILYGDVGSGKTLVAAMALRMAYCSGRQAVLLAPTEILAKQHYELLQKLMPDENIVFLTSSTRSKKIYEQIKQETCIIIGTHAVLQKKVEYKNLGLLIIDEQHRFGVMQRMAIDQGLCYNVLLMTATPIPRTLQLSLNNSIDVSQIVSRPQKHRDIKVELSYRLDDIVLQIKTFLDKNQNIFWVCPMIEKSETREAMDVTTRFEHLKSLFGSAVGFVHGKMNYKDKEDVLRRFYDREIRILVSTTVIEVGINVPHANLMVIENPEIFGLAQLYQLIGRVGRGSDSGLCYLFHGFISNESKDRLRTLQTCKSGLELAEHDLYLRGSGNLLGTEQSGDDHFHLFDMTDDYNTLAEAQDVLQKLGADFNPGSVMEVFSYLYSPWSGG